MELGDDQQVEHDVDYETSGADQQWHVWIIQSPSTVRYSDLHRRGQRRDGRDANVGYGSLSDLRRDECGGKLVGSRDEYYGHDES